MGQEIKKRRVELGLSQAKLGERVGVSRTMIGLYEDDKNHPRGRPATQLSKVLGIAPEKFSTIKNGVIRVDTPNDVHIIPLIGLMDIRGGLAGLAEMLAIKEFSETDGLRVSSEFESCIGVQVTDDAMSPDYKTGDIAIVDRANRTYDGRDVLVSIATGVSIIRHCRFRGYDVSGTAVYDLSTPNPNEKTITVNGSEPYEMLGVVVQMRRVPYGHPPP